VPERRAGGCGWLLHKRVLTELKPKRDWKLRGVGAE
jgi:hypothetical protein